MIDTGLRDKVVLITGANNPLGIGAATARAFSGEKAKVCVTYLRLDSATRGFSQDEINQAEDPGMALYHRMRTKSAHDVIEAIRGAGGTADALELDLTGSDAPSQLFNWAEKSFGPVDVLVNNASHYGEADTISTTTSESLEHTFSVNVRSTVLMISEFVKRHKSRGAKEGRVINLSTDAAQNFPTQIAYGASKAAIEAFTRSIAEEAGPLGITVNTVAPGPTQTGYITKEKEEEEVPQIPLRRLGRPEDIADVIVFLASQQARWLTGQVIRVSGGHAI